MTDQAPKTDDKKLTAKQVAFVAHYMACHNATEAAKRAGYAGTEKSLATIGWENLRKLEIQTEIQRRTREIMPEPEIVQRYADMARNDLGNYFTIGEEEVVLETTETVEVVDPGDAVQPKIIERRVTKTIAKRPIVLLDLRKAKRDNKLKLVKKYSTGPTGERIELYDAQTALHQVGEFLGMWVKKHEISGDPAKPVVVKVLNGVSMDEL